MHPLQWRLAAYKLYAAVPLGGCNSVWLFAEAESFSDPHPADQRGAAPNKKQRGMNESSIYELIGTLIPERQARQKIFFDVPRSPLARPSPPWRRGR